MTRHGLGYRYSEAGKCTANGLIYLPITGRCETPGQAAQIIEAARRQGIGFLAPGNDEQGGDDISAFGYDYAYDDFWNWDYDFNSSGGGGFPDLTFDPYQYPATQPTISASGNEDRYWFDWGQFLRDFLAGNVDRIETSAPYKTSGGNVQPWGVPDWISATPQMTEYPEDWKGTGSNSALPGYCKGGTYHPTDDPFACVPFPADDQTKKRQAAVQRQGQQQQARQARAQQQQANKNCPKDPKGRPVWRNPATNQCELVPTCPTGQSFDQVAKRCLTAAQKRELYGSQLTWVWWIVGGVVFLVAYRQFSNNQSPARRKR